MTIADDLFIRVPVGEENAVGSRLLWQQIGKWGRSSVRGELGKMTAQGLIRSKVKRRGQLRLSYISERLRRYREFG